MENNFGYWTLIRLFRGCAGWKWLWPHITQLVAIYLLACNVCIISYLVRHIALHAMYSVICGSTKQPLYTVYCTLFGWCIFGTFWDNISSIRIVCIVVSYRSLCELKIAVACFANRFSCFGFERCLHYLWLMGWHIHTHTTSYVDAMLEWFKSPTIAYKQWGCIFVAMRVGFDVLLCVCVCACVVGVLQGCIDKRSHTVYGA